MACALEGDVHAEAVGTFTYLRCHIRRVGIEDLAEAKALGLRATLRIGLGDIDRARSGGGGAQRGERADRARTRNEDAIPRPNASAGDPVRGDRTRLDQGALLVGHLVRDRGTPGTPRAPASSAIPPQAELSPVQAIVVQRCCRPLRQYSQRPQ